MPTGQRIAGWLLALALAAAASAAASGCGAAPRAAAPAGYSLRDGDRDTDDKRPPLDFGNDDETVLAAYPDRAAPAETRTIAALVKRYYAAAAAGQGARACALLAPGIATGVEGQYGRAGQAGHEGCAAPMTRLLAQEHKTLLAENVATMLVASVRLNGDLALAVLRFRAAPESQLALAREGGGWRIGTLQGSYMP